MEKLINKYYEKLVKQKICPDNTPLLGGLDAELVWNRNAPEIKIFEKIIEEININSILFAPPVEPYFSILNYLSKNNATIYPEDCETRTFLHDIPVTKDFTSESVIEGLKKRKGIFIPNHGIVSYGTVTPEQAFVTFCSICFSAYVKFFTNYYKSLKNNNITDGQSKIFKMAIDDYQNFIDKIIPKPDMIKGPFVTKEQTIQAIIQAGKLTVDCKMVDSFFGNISYKLGERIFVSQTGSSLDELAGCIDNCPIDGSSTSSVTASSEYSAHRQILTETDNLAILHGHPKFSVIISMICNNEVCECKEQCFIKCPDKRFFKDIPIVPGEVGTGPCGLCNTIPPAIKNNRGVIVYGHGLFTTGKIDFTNAFANLIDIEKSCFKEITNW